MVVEGTTATAMDWYVWALFGAVGFAVVIALYRLRDRTRAKADRKLTPVEVRKKKALEDMADNLSP
jgi:hypothetical protein